MACLASAELRAASATGELRAASAVVTTRGDSAEAELRAARALGTVRTLDTVTATIRCVAVHDDTLVTQLLEPVLLDGDLIAVTP
jgi:hypothetical protein